MECRTSREVMGVPSSNFSPSLSAYVQVRPPSEDLPMSVARSPTNFVFPVLSSTW